VVERGMFWTKGGKKQKQTKTRCGWALIGTADLPWAAYKKPLILKEEKK
jgi:hypothetical protein